MTTTAKSTSSALAPAARNISVTSAPKAAGTAHPRIGPSGEATEISRRPPGSRSVLYSESSQVFAGSCDWSPITRPDSMLAATERGEAVDQRGHRSRQKCRDRVRDESGLDTEQRPRKAAGNRPQRDAHGFELAEESHDKSVAPPRRRL